MPVLVGAVVLLGVLCLMNIALSLAMVRRLREFGERLTGHPAPGVPQPQLLASGTPLPDFHATDLTGQPVSLPTGPGIVGFFSTGCDVCHTQVAPFVQLAGESGFDRTDVLAVVITDKGSDGADMARALASAATVVVEQPDGPTAVAFRVSAFPSFYLVADGVVRAGSVVVRKLPAPTVPVR